MGAVGNAGGTIVVVDVLRFSTAVEAAVAARARAFPYWWRDASAEAFAASLGAVLADGHASAGPSLSPASLLGLPAGTSVVLRSLNGSACSLLAAETGARVVAGCLRNATAVAQWVKQQPGPVSVVAAGEHWPDGSLRPCVEDLVGAGAILRHLPGKLSPEAAAAVGAFVAMEGELADVLSHSASALELSEKGHADDVAYSLTYDTSTTVPVLVDGAFTGAAGGPTSDFEGPPPLSL